METSLKDPAIMLSYFIEVKKGKPSSRLRTIMKIRKARKENKDADQHKRK